MQQKDRLVSGPNYCPICKRFVKADLESGIDSVGQIYNRQGRFAQPDGHVCGHVWWVPTK